MGARVAAMVAGFITKLRNRISMFCRVGMIREIDRMPFERPRRRVSQDREQQNGGAYATKHTISLSQTMGMVFRRVVGRQRLFNHQVKI
jgi:hypothetical protein